ncbi:DUF1622 domain-containing protein [Anaerorhabdus sp.]|uniref:DUF1622 domain-containing protein n=1 Tax=Anaerorhabdus sp. TaxID=1872524 RepID=UPI002FCB86C1
MEKILDLVLTDLVNYAILFFEFIGVIILIISGIKGLINYINKNPKTRLDLAKGMAMGLEFKLGSEILRTVIAQDVNDLIITGFVVILRAALTFLIHWEIKNQEMARITTQGTAEQKD